MLADLIRERTRPIITAECPSMDGGTVADLARKLEGTLPYVDAVNATDNPAAHAHASNTATAIALQQLGTEAIMQIVCRDKNRIAIQADVAGASMFGVHAFAALTGDDVTAGDEPEARRVYDIDGPQLVSVLASMRDGKYLSGRTFNPPEGFLITAVENPAAPPFEYRPQRALLKVRAGAQLLQLQICYQAERLASFMADCVANGAAAQAAILPSFCLTKTARALTFMDEQVPGIGVPAELIARIKDADDQAEASYQLVRDQVVHALSLPGVAGIHLTDFRHDGSLARLLEELQLGPAFDKTVHQGVIHAHSA